jgi:SHS2 domain-containing protein
VVSSRRGHRVVSHTADLRVEAWAPTREECIAEAVAGAVASFVDTESAGRPSPHCATVQAESAEDLLVAVLDEVVYLMDTTGEVPVQVVVEADGGGATVRLAMVPVEGLPQVGAVPKAVSLHQIRLVRGAGGWECSVTLDV